MIHGLIIRGEQWQSSDLLSFVSETDFNCMSGGFAHVPGVVFAQIKSCPPHNMNKRNITCINALSLVLGVMDTFIFINRIIRFLRYV